MFQKWFKHSLPDAPTVCLKLRLKEYCLGHDILLTRLESSLVGPEPTVNPTALLIACLICSQAWEEAAKSLRSQWLGFFLRFWKWRLGRVEWLSETVKFLNYRSEGLWMPEVNPPAHGRTLNSPWQYRLAMSLMRDLHLSESEALNIPLTRAHAYYAAMGDVDGTMSLFGPKEEAMLSKIAELERNGE